MGAADLEILRQMWAEMLSSVPAEMDEAAAERWWHPEIKYVEDPKWPGSTTYRGREAVIRAWHGYLEIFGSVEMKVEELRDAGDEVVAIVRLSGVSKGGDVPFEHQWAYRLPGARWSARISTRLLGSAGGAGGRGRQVAAEELASGSRPSSPYFQSRYCRIRRESFTTSS